MFVNTLSRSAPSSTVGEPVLTFTRVQLIKFIRSITGLGLYEAKALCDANFVNDGFLMLEQNRSNIETVIIGLNTVNALKKEQS
jgi:hypothetical protein